MNLPESVRNPRKNAKVLGPRVTADGDFAFATVRWDDELGNGSNTFSVCGVVLDKNTPGAFLTAEAHDKAPDRFWVSCGQCVTARDFPELAEALPFHLCSADGPLHYVGNTTYLAGDRDHHGLRKGERVQIRNGRTGLLCWVRHAMPSAYFDGPERPVDTVTAQWEPLMRTGEGKERQLEQARRAAVWPDATDEELSAGKEELQAALLARLPALMLRFKAVVESLGFVY